MSAENLGAQFNMELYTRARQQTISTVKRVGKLIKPGMTEKMAHQILLEELQRLGVEKFWHPSKFRLNINTVRNFSEPSDETVLGEDDIFFIDIGPVFYNHEGDYGETFVVGQNPRLHHLKDATRKVYDAVAKVFKEKKLTGVALYQVADAEAKKLNLKLSPSMYGHRLGDFPHALHFRGDLGEYGSIPKSDLWVLEIHLLDEELGRGAFFEDILS